MRAKKPPISRVIDEIIDVNSQIANFWQNGGWAQGEASKLLSQSRLDRQVALSRTLKLWIKRYPAGQEDARLILGWANLGTLIEGSLKFFLCVFHHDYVGNPIMDHRKGKRVEPDGMMLEILRQFFVKVVWTPDSWKHWGDFVAQVQRRRNAIHAFQERDLGDRDELHEAIRTYLEFVNWVNRTIPYPDP